MAREHPIHLGLRVGAMLLGLPLLTLAVAATLGLGIESPGIALGVASAITILPTLLLADRLLPADDPRKGKGIATDVISLVWLGGAVLAFGPLGPFLHDPLVAYVERATGSEVAVAVADFVTGVPERDADDARAAEDDGAAIAEDGGVAGDGGP